MGKIIEEIETGLVETQTQLQQWLKTAPEEKQEHQLGTADETAVENRLHVLHDALEKAEAGTLGICEVCHEPVEEELLRMDYTSCVCLGHYSETELRALERDLELSQVVQRALLPQRPPDIAGIDTAAFSRPASIVSGDYFDFVQFKNGTHGFIVADVSGHGVSAGMLMTSLQTAFQTLAPETNSPLEVLERINRLYLHNINFTTFVTIFFGQFDPATRIFKYANAGHNSGYLYRPSQKAEVWLHPTGPAIGLTEGYPTRIEQVELLPGDSLVLYTDGITEAGNAGREPYGEDRLAEAIRGNAETSPERLIQAIVHDLTQFAQGVPFEDDTTLVVLKAR